MPTPIGGVKTEIPVNRNGDRWRFKRSMSGRIETSSGESALQSERNIDTETVAGFGFEWQKFTQADVDAAELLRSFNRYFSIFPWELLPVDGGVGADIGCGSGRWARFIAPRVTRLHLIDASQQALDVARANLAGMTNVEFHRASVGELPFAENSLDFAYSLGVLHHVPDTLGAIRSIKRVLKPGAPFLVYLYYSFDNRPRWYRLLWSASNQLRLLVSRMPIIVKYSVSQAIALLVYWPLARSFRLLESAGITSSNWPLREYAHSSFYSMRTDALDRFGTRLEQRFSRQQIRECLEDAGFKRIRFAETPPYWCAIGVRD